MTIAGVTPQVKHATLDEEPSFYGAMNRCRSRRGAAMYPRRSLCRPP
jgi:hypothetical protein